MRGEVATENVEGIRMAQMGTRERGGNAGSEVAEVDSASDAGFALFPRGRRRHFWWVPRVGGRRGRREQAGLRVRWAKRPSRPKERGKAHGPSPSGVREGERREASAARPGCLRPSTGGKREGERWAAERVRRRGMSPRGFPHFRNSFSIFY